MANKQQVRIDFDVTTVLGLAEFSDKQLANLEYVGATRLNSDLIYVIPRQWIHSSKLKRPINGKETSNKVYVLGFNAEGQMVTVLTIALNSLTQQFYGLVKDGPLVISAVKNGDSLYRAIAGTSQTSVWLKGGLPLRVQNKNVYISRDIAFKLSSRESVYTGKFKQVSNGWDMLVKHTSDDVIIDLGVQTMNLLEEVSAIPSYSLDQLGEAQVCVEQSQKDLP